MFYKNERLLLSWIVWARTHLFFSIFNVLFSIAQSPTISNIFFKVASWVLWLCFFLVVCAFKEEVKKAKKPARETLPYQINPKAPVPPSGFIDIEAIPDLDS